MDEKKIVLKPYIIAGIISLLFGISSFCLVVFAFKKAYVDGAAFAAIFLISTAILIWISREGFFDLAGYGFKQFGNMLFSKKPNAYNDYAGYKEYKRESRENRANYYISTLIVGALFLFAAIILFVVYKL